MVSESIKNLSATDPSTETIPIFILVVPTHREPVPAYFTTQFASIWAYLKKLPSGQSVWFGLKELSWLVAQCWYTDWI